MDPTIIVGSAKALGLKVKPAESGQSRPEQPEGGTKRHKEWPTVGASDAPLRGPDILKPFRFSTRITWERRVKPLGPDLIVGH
jgi:hypothetical protein